VPLSVNVAAKPGYVTSLPAPVQRVGAQPHTAALIQGQLIIEGLGLPTRDHALRQAVILPTETDTRPAILDAAAFAATQTVTLNVFNDGSDKNDVGTLGRAVATSELAAVYGQPMNTLDMATFGSIAGFGMASGGIVYHNVQIVDVMLGTGDDTFTVNDTTAGSVTVVQGGGGSNRLIANGGGGADAPLVLFGGTSQDGSFYSSTVRHVDGHARTFSNAGDNIIDARNATKSVIMYGGVGRDTIYGGRGDDWIAGGSGANTLDGRGGNDILLGASGFNIDLSERLSRSSQMLTVVSAASRTDNRITGDKLSAGSNRISGGTGNNIVFGDYGVVVQEDGVQSITTTGRVDFLKTTRPSNGANNVIDVGDGNNVVFGALFDDVITAGKGRNVLFGEFGSVHYENGIVDSVAGVHAGLGGKNQITAGGGKNTIIGGAGADNISATGGDNAVLADEGVVAFRSGVLVSIDAKKPEFGGDDRITLGHGNNVVVGGNGMDKISTGNGNNVLFGDSGRASYVKGVLTYAGTVGTGHGGNDAITVGNGANIVIGGVGADSIIGGDGKNRIIGDDGNLGFVQGELSYISTRNENLGGDDRITIGAGDNVAFGGVGSDTIQAGGGKNILFGDVGAVQYREGTLSSVQSHYAGFDGDNQITAGNGVNVIVGGVRSDAIVVGNGANIILGDHGEVAYGAGVLVSLKTQDPLSGGDDDIKSGSGMDVILGGTGSDRIDGGSGNNVVIGEHGRVRFDPSGKAVSTVEGISLGYAGNNKIDVGTGNSIIIGGTGTNTITGGDGQHIVFGAEGLVHMAHGKMTSAVSTTQFGGGDNVIAVGSGGSIVFGGGGNSAITAGDGDNIVIGHNGEVTTVGGQLRSVRTTYAHAGDAAGISIKAGDGANLILGGSGGNTITVGDGDNRIAGVNAEMLFVDGKLATFRTLDPNYHGMSQIKVGGGSNIIMGGGGADTIVAGDGKNTVIGDNGVVRLNSDGSPTIIMSIDPSYGADDQITVGAGDSVIVGGSGANTITVGNGNDIVFGGGGRVQYDGGKIVEARTIDPAFTGNATITTGAGASVVFGGSGSNRISAGNGNNRIIGANGLAQYADGKISMLRSLDPFQGASNRIETGNGGNVIFGGRSHDVITAGDGGNIVIGEHGLVRFDPSGAATDIRVIYPDSDGDDQISVGSGDNIVLGAGGTNTISAGDGHNIVFANDGLVQFAAGKLALATTADPLIGSGTAGSITVGSGGSLVFGGAGDGAITAGDGDDIIIGHNGSVQYENGKLSLIGTSSPGNGSSVAIVAGGGDNLILGGSGANSIAADDGDNIIVGHNGSIRFVDGMLSVASTRDPQYGGSASILTGDGRNIVIGGTGYNSITTGDGDNIALGANGQAIFANGHLVSVRIIAPSYGGSVNIVTGAGDDIIIGGGYSSTIRAGSGTNIVIVHEGYVKFVDDVISRAQSTNQFFGSTAEIRADNGNDVVIAGSGTTATYLGDGNHVVIMDNGYVRFSGSGVPTSAGTLFPGYAGIDSVITGNGNNVIFRGFAGDYVSTGTGTTIDLGQRPVFDLTRHGAFWQQVERKAPVAVTASAMPTTDMLAMTVAQAKQIWRDALAADSIVLGALDRVHVELGSLPAGKLGLNVGDLIVIDADAAGWGWFIDPTPGDSAEFDGNPSSGVMTASPDQPAAGHMDMLSTVLHELGNALGFREDAGRDVMGMRLRAGDRTMPVAEPPSRVDGATAGTDRGTAVSRIGWASTEPADRNTRSFSVPAWLSDFLFNSGEGAASRNPNADIRVTVPIVTKPTE
jgi:Ca2+-binding RTX toxin-like protein